MVQFYKSNNLTLNEIYYLGKVFIASGLFKDVQAQAQAIVKIMAGQEIGLTPIVSMNKINIIKGKISIAAELMASLIKKSGEYDYEVIEHNETKCSIQFFKKGKKGYLSTFTMGNAVTALLFKDDPMCMWKKYPKAMLFSRALSQGARIECPHVINNCYTAEEMGANVTEDGEVISVETETPKSKVKAMPTLQDNGNGSQPAAASENQNIAKMKAEALKILAELKKLGELSDEKYQESVAWFNVAKKASLIEEQLKKIKAKLPPSPMTVVKNKAMKLGGNDLVKAASILKDATTWGKNTLKIDIPIISSLRSFKGTADVLQQISGVIDHYEAEVLNKKINGNGTAKADPKPNGQQPAVATPQKEVEAAI